VRVRYEHQVDVVVIKYILRTFKSVVSADEILHFLRITRTEHVRQLNVEHLSAVIVVLREVSLSQLFRHSVQLPVDRLEHAEDETQQSERCRRHCAFQQHRIPRRPQCTDETAQIPQLHCSCSVYSSSTPMATVSLSEYIRRWPSAVAELNVLN